MALFCFPYQCACFTFVFGLKTCFIFHLFLCILSSVIIYTLNKAATFRITILYKKGLKLQDMMPHQEFTLKFFDLKTLFLWGKKNLEHFCVFSD